MTTNVLANLADLGMLNSTTSPMAPQTGGSPSPNLLGARNISASGETFDTDESFEERGK